MFNIEKTLFPHVEEYFKKCLTKHVSKLRQYCSEIACNSKDEVSITPKRDITDFSLGCGGLIKRGCRIHRIYNHDSWAKEDGNDGLNRILERLCITCNDGLDRFLLDALGSEVIEYECGVGEQRQVPFKAENTIPIDFGNETSTQNDALNVGKIMEAACNLKSKNRISNPFLICVVEPFGFNQLYRDYYKIRKGKFYSFEDIAKYVGVDVIVKLGQLPNNVDGVDGKRYAYVYDRDALTLKVREDFRGIIKEEPEYFYYRVDGCFGAQREDEDGVYRIEYRVASKKI